MLADAGDHMNKYDISTSAANYVVNPFKTSWTSSSTSTCWPVLWPRATVANKVRAAASMSSAEPEVRCDFRYDMPQVLPGRHRIPAMPCRRESPR